MAFKVLEDGSSVAFSDDTDPNEISRTLREKNLDIELAKKVNFKTN